jgi:thiosulfate dehydrogenase
MNLKQFSHVRRLAGIIAISFITLVFAGCSAEEEEVIDEGGNTITSGAKPFDTSCLSYEPTLNQALAIASAEKGGQLYDKWWATRNFSPDPLTDHPLWNQQNTNNGTPADSWRCKECHGWDYKGKDGAYGPDSSHYTGFPGIMAAADKSPIDVFCMITSGTEAYPDHKFNALSFNYRLTTGEVTDLVKFITETDGVTGLVDTSLYINASGAPVNSNTTTGGNLFVQLSCGAEGLCHGATGATHPSSEPLGQMADENPWELMHKFRFGHPGNLSMPAFASASYNKFPADAANVIAYAQQSLLNPASGGTDSTGGTGGTSTEAGKMALGGRLYDNWPKIKGQTTMTDNPVWNLRDQTSSTGFINLRTGADTWRCKECHGWDYKGVNGVYSTGDHYTGFNGLFGTIKTEQEVINFISNGFRNLVSGQIVHNYALQLSADEIASLAHFIKNGGIIDTGAYIIEATNTQAYKSSKGDRIAGKTIYSSIANGGCTVCHGITGQTINFGTTPPEYLGTLANSNPWEVLHKARFGQPASPTSTDPVMPGMVEGGFSVTDSSNVLAHTQTLPQ